ncbi:hypothetical protein [Bosea sp. 117]|uniref:hypothetical protein n=1 Tax=Bosea sp. 117 TaxID=1125973 RepID=UPI00049472D5|nr:hypothetical protein [Bosea sp. 117]
MILARALLVATLALTSVSAFAGETKTFLIDSSDGYGIDGCIASGAACGAAMAGAWCRAHDFERAVSFGTVESDARITAISTAPVRTACIGGSCSQAVAISCEK